jgi:hypothetical protein
MLKAFAFRAVPALNCVRSPLSGLVGVAIVAGVGRPKLDEISGREMPML